MNRTKPLILHIVTMLKGTFFTAYPSALNTNFQCKIHGNNKISLQNYSKDVASFICWWTHFVKKDLNGFSGFSHVKFEPQGFDVIQQQK